RAYNAYCRNPYQLFYWRSRSGVEVDFVLYGERGIYAIEVKNSNRIRPQDLRGLTAFQNDYPQSKALLLYRGEETLLKKNIICMPSDIFLKNLTPGQDISSIF
ncbi:MAG: DUF4143 domain-containing protein, partial [bacterium]